MSILLSQFGIHAQQGVVSSPEGTGGTTNEFSQNGDNYRCHTFESNGTFTVTSAGFFEILVQAGGGSGGAWCGGGGGAGQLKIFSDSFSSLRTGQAIFLTPGNYTVTVGVGGASVTATDDGIDSGKKGNKGNDSSFHDIACEGGGAGGGRVRTDTLIETVSIGGDGGNGGGAGGHYTTDQNGVTVPDQPGGSGDFNGGNANRNNSANNACGGGGGGTSANGQNGLSNDIAFGGAGKELSFDGTMREYGRGGYGRNNDGSQQQGLPSNPPKPTEFGWGGPAARGANGTSAEGGDGVVKVRYKID